MSDKLAIELLKIVVAGQGYPTPQGGFHPDLIRDVRNWLSHTLKEEHANALKVAAEHPQHHIFSVHSGAIVQSSCGCGEQFPTQGSCEAWQKHILNL